MTVASEIYIKAVELLGRREHSRVELQRKLHKKFSSVEEQALSADINDVCNRLSDQGYQSDSRFAESYIRARVARGFGPKRIRSELVGKGIDSQLAQHLLERLHESSELQKQLLDVWRKKFTALPANLAEKSRQQRFLLYRGFTPEQVEHFYASLTDTVC